MSGDGGGGPEGGAPGIRELTVPEIAKREQFVADRKARAARRNRGQDPGQGVPETEATIAYEEAVAMDKAIERARDRGVPEEHILTRVNQRPEFRLTGEPRFAFDDISLALEKNSFGPTRELLAGAASWRGVELEDIGSINESVGDMVADRLHTLAAEGDGKHFVAAVSYLGEYLRPAILPKESERSPKIPEALAGHAISTFADPEKKPEQIADELQQFSRLHLLDKVSELPEFRDAVGQRLLATFDKRSMTDFASNWAVCRYLGIPYQPEGEVLSELQNRGLSWVEESLTTGEEDPITPLELLSQFMDDPDPEIMGIELSAKQVRERPGLLQRVQDTIQKAESALTDDDDPRKEMLADLSLKLSA